MRCEHETARYNCWWIALLFVILGAMQLFSNRAMTASMKAQVKFWALTGNMFEMVEFIVQWLAAPIAAFVWALHLKIGKHDTSIAVLEAQIASDKLAMIMK